MRICLVNLWHDRDCLDPDAQIEADVTRRGFAEALAARGHEVHVVQELPNDGVRERAGVTWHFVPAPRTTRLQRATLAAVGQTRPVILAPATHLAAAVRRLRPEVIHSFDLVAYLSLTLLGDVARDLGAALVAHFHGGDPARVRAWRAVERRALAGVDRLLFTTRTHGRRWVESGALPDEGRIVALTETSTFFRPGARKEARTRTGLAGDPVILCPGRLAAVKDPMTTLRGFASVRARRPGARLYLAYTSDELLPDARALVAGDSRLRDAVHFLGRQTHAQMEDLFRSADVVVQASVREVCGVAVLEALACGAVPVVTDIPSFRTLTADGTVGRLFAPGDAEGLAHGVLDLLDGKLHGVSLAARRHFTARLAFPALAAQLDDVYRDALTARSSRSA